jgi:hypothetical protein
VAWSEADGLSKMVEGTKRLFAVIREAIRVREIDASDQA